MVVEILAKVAGDVWTSYVRGGSPICDIALGLTAVGVSLSGPFWEWEGGMIALWLV